MLSGSASQRSVGLTGNSQGAVVRARQEDEEGVGLNAVLSARTWTLISCEELCERGNVAVLSLKRTKEIIVLLIQHCSAAVL